MPLNTHRAYILVYKAKFTDKNGEEYIKEFDEPRHKMIASGSFEFCSQKLVDYGQKHQLDNVRGGVVKVASGVEGNPWANEWPEV